MYSKPFTKTLNPSTGCAPHEKKARHENALSSLRNTMAPVSAVGRNSHLKLYGFDNHYKIKLRASGYRLVYEMVEAEIFLYVIAICKSDKNAVYKKAKKRK